MNPTSKKNPAVCVSAILSLAVFACLSGRAMAASDPVQNSTSGPKTVLPSCSIQEEADALTNAINKPLDDYNLQLKKELDLRKSLTSKIIACALVEVDSVKQNLSSLQIDDQDISRRKNELSQEINRTIAFYKSQADGVSGLGLRSSQETAVKIREWRASTFYPALQAINNLSLWIHNNDLLKTAVNRNDQIVQTVKSLNLDDNPEISSKIDDASKNLSDAASAHVSARTEILKPSWDNDSLPYIKMSLEKLGSVYQDFLSVSDLVQAKLKTK